MAAAKEPAEHSLSRAEHIMPTLNHKARISILVAITCGAITILAALDLTNATQAPLIMSPQVQIAAREIPPQPSRTILNRPRLTKIYNVCFSRDGKKTCQCDPNGINPVCCSLATTCLCSPTICG